METLAIFNQTKMTAMWLDTSRLSGDGNLEIDRALEVLSKSIYLKELIVTGTDSSSPLCLNFLTKLRDLVAKMRPFKLSLRRTDMIGCLEFDRHVRQAESEIRRLQFPFQQKDYQVLVMLAIPLSVIRTAGSSCYLPMLPRDILRCLARYLIKGE